jgi:5'-methylthioadenosine phosphorylase
MKDSKQNMRACVVVGSSFSQENIENLQRISLQTPFGEGEIFRILDSESYLQFRHGCPHRFLPNQINWRAQAWMWKELNIDVLLLTSSVGVMDPQIPLYTPLIASDLLMPFNQLPDGSSCSLFTTPQPNHGHLLLQDGMFHSGLNTYLRRQIEEKGFLSHDVIFAYVPGPRTKTPIENRFWQQQGAQVNSMSIGPEAVLANELQIPVTALLIGHKYSLPSSPTASQKKHTHQSIDASLQESKKASEELIWNFLRKPPQVSFANHLYQFS